MRRITSAITVGALGVGLLAGPVAVAAPAVATGPSAGSETVIRYGDRIQFSTNACIQPGTKDEYRILVTASPFDSRVDDGYVELIHGAVRTRVPSKMKKMRVLDEKGNESPEIIAATYDFSNPKGLPYQITVDGFTSKVFEVLPSALVDDTVNDETPADAATRKSSIAGWKSSSVTMTSAAAKSRKVTITAPEGRTLNVDEYVAGKWKRVRTVHLSTASKQTVRIKTSTVAQRAGTHRYRVVLSRSESFDKTVKTIKITSSKAKQRSKVKAVIKGARVVVRATSTEKIPSKALLQKKVGKKWRTLATKKSPNASATFTIKKSKGSYRVVIRALRNNATNGVARFRLR